MPRYTNRYQIPYPEAGDPIHEGAAQMRALADTVDEVMGDVSDASALDATHLATPGRIIQRDANGRAKVAHPDDEDDVATKKTVDDLRDDISDRLNGLSFQVRSTPPPASTPSTMITFVVES